MPLFDRLMAVLQMKQQPTQATDLNAGVSSLLDSKITSFKRKPIQKDR